MEKEFLKLIKLEQFSAEKAKRRTEADNTRAKYQPRKKKNERELISLREISAGREERQDGAEKPVRNISWNSQMI